ncbi:MAG: hypothetical protein EOO40_05835 [Deltaproteobacteria bacterium]|nr:MAG: hypothetical protein EOO40_05835 [Deltaproteobacteria bacterium]
MGQLSAGGATLGYAMVLGCRLEHLRNQNVLVNGNTYRVGDNGIVTDIAEADAWKLLASSGSWYRIGSANGGEGPLDPSRELDTPEDQIPRDANGDLRVLELGPDQIDLRGGPLTAEDIRKAAAMIREDPNYAQPSLVDKRQSTEADDANLAAHSHQAPAIPPAQAAAPGAANMPGIPPVEAPGQSGLAEDLSFRHAPDGHIEPVKKRRGRPPRAKVL